MIWWSTHSILLDLMFNLGIDLWESHSSVWYTSCSPQTISTWMDDVTFISALYSIFLVVVHFLLLLKWILSLILWHWSSSCCSINAFRWSASTLELLQPLLLIQEEGFFSECLASIVSIFLFIHLILVFITLRFLLERRNLVRWIVILYLHWPLGLDLLCYGETH